MKVDLKVDLTVEALKVFLTPRCSLPEHNVKSVLNFRGNVSMVVSAWPSGKMAV